MHHLSTPEQPFPTSPRSTTEGCAWLRVPLPCWPPGFGTPLPQPPLPGRLSYLASCVPGSSSPELQEAGAGGATLPSVGVEANTRALDFLRNGIEFYMSASGREREENAIEGQVVTSVWLSLYRSVRFRVK